MIMLEMSRLTVTLLIHWQITFLIILPLLSVQKEGNVIPKPGRDPTNPTKYRHIVLTSGICKTMSRMIKHRFV